MGIKEAIIEQGESLKVKVTDKQVIETIIGDIKLMDYDSLEGLLEYMYGVKASYNVDEDVILIKSENLDLNEIF
jgi:TusA-related sulfurtransferase